MLDEFYPEQPFSEQQLDRELEAGNAYCIAPKLLFTEDYEDVPGELKRLIPSTGLGCDGGGRCGVWCTGCPWCWPGASG